MLQNRSIKSRLILVIMLVSAVSVLLTTLAITLIGVVTLKENIKSEMQVTAGMIGARNAAAIAFDDREAATANLDAALSTTPSLQHICVYTVKGSMLASASQPVTADDPAPRYSADQCPSVGKNYATLTPHFVEVLQEILNRGRIGYIYLKSDLSKVDEFIHQQVITGIAVTLAVLLVSFLLALRFQRSISRPVVQLTETAKEITFKKDYTVRARWKHGYEPGSRNEIATLIESFNAMISEIQSREDALMHKNVELEAAKDAAEEANRSKSQFLANISHELRTPLNAIIGFSSILVNQLFGVLGNPKYQEYAQDINHSGLRLLDVFNDIIDMAKAETGNLRLQFEDVNVEKTIRKCLTLMGERTKESGVAVYTDIQKELPVVMADRLRFIQIILNLLSNAIKFTEEGGNVTLTVRTDDPDPKAAKTLVVAIQDTGIGMTESDIAKAFQSFGQVDGGLNRRYEGTGLGLPLTNTLVQLHKGTLTLSSAIGKGTTATVTLPLKQS